MPSLLSVIADSKGGSAMAECEVCGNEYDKTFEVKFKGRTHTFDSFECAISALAPRCEVCGVRIVGHGVESDGAIFCCGHCAARQGETAIRDRA
jgi:ribosome-binding protein aMBF1 (putative translation factor)